MTEKERQRAGFLAAIAENEDDDTIHQVYADWLDEQGEYEEATRQRKWTQAKQWIVDVIKEADYSEYYDYADDRIISYDTVVKMATDAYNESKEDGWSTPEAFVGSAESFGEYLRHRIEDFWKNWSIVTGLPLPEEWANDGYDTYFRCAC